MPSAEPILLRPSAASALHVAIIMDGNGRWAEARGLPRLAGHRAGVEAARRVVDAAPRLGIRVLTLFAFSSDNWQRPEGEVAALMQLLEEYFRGEVEWWLAHGVRVNVVGRRDRLPSQLRAAAQGAESAAAAGRTLNLRIAIDYSAREAILRAACRFYTTLEISKDAFARYLAAVTRAGTETPDVDLLIRTGGEQRLSDFLLWESAYAELYFTKRLWPDFDAADLEAAMREFYARERRFGRIPAAAAS